MMEMRGNFCAVVIAHLRKGTTGRCTGQNGMRTEQSQRKAQLIGKRSKSFQQGNIAHAATGRSIVTRKETFFFHIKTDDDIQGRG